MLLFATLLDYTDEETDGVEVTEEGAKPKRKTNKQLRKAARIHDQAATLKNIERVREREHLRSLSKTGKITPKDTPRLFAKQQKLKSVQYTGGASKPQLPTKATLDNLTEMIPSEHSGKSRFGTLSQTVNRHITKDNRHLRRGKFLRNWRPSKIDRATGSNKPNLQPGAVADRIVGRRRMKRFAARVYKETPGDKLVQSQALVPYQTKAMQKQAMKNITPPKEQVTALVRSAPAASTRVPPQVINVKPTNVSLVPVAAKRNINIPAASSTTSNASKVSRFSRFLPKTRAGKIGLAATGTAALATGGVLAARAYKKRKAAQNK